MRVAIRKLNSPVSTLAAGIFGEAKFRQNLTSIYPSSGKESGRATPFSRAKFKAMLSSRVRAASLKFHLGS